ncbi:peroxisome assembly protein 12 [Stigmatopora argus]
MAEAGAHLTSGTASEQPSIFELLAQESLMEAVKPALRHAVKVLAESNPSRFGFLWRRFDELYLLLDVLLQNHFLSNCGASFSENFYGLKRLSGSRGLPVGSARWRSLLLLCLAPYLRAKLEATFARQREEEDFSIRLAQSRIQKLYRAAVAVYPYVDSAWRAWIFCQQLLYVFGASRTHHPLLWLAGVRLARLTQSDIRDMEMKKRQNPILAGDSALQRLRRWTSQGAKGLAVSLSTSLSLGVFFLQFLEWWYSSEQRATAENLASLPAPPPPLHLQTEDATSCPLCRRPRVNAAALSTSGLVFCYRCIFAYVKAKRRCPISGYPSQLQHLIKIYSPDS